LDPEDPRPAAGAEPAAAPAPGDGIGAGTDLATAKVSLESLVHHNGSVAFDMTLEDVQARFRTHDVEFLAVERAAKVVGLCSRGQLGFAMGSRFGFAIYSKDTVSTLMVPRPLIVTRATPLREVLARALVRKAEEFIDDVVLVNEDQCLIGLIKVEVLAHVQSRLVSEQLDELHRQHETLRLRNLELFRANHAARQSQGLYLGLFTSHTIGIALLDTAGGIHEYNARLAELLGIPGSARPASLASWVAESERPEFLALLQAQATGADEAANHEFTFEIAARGTRTIRCSMGWIRETGQVCACLDDVTEQRAMERNIVRQEKQRLLDTLVGGIAHELNNKLAPIMGFAELLRQDFGSESAAHVDLIMKSVEEAARIIRQLLELSKPASQNILPVDLRAVAEETLAILRFQLREAGCAVRTILPPGPVTVTGDAGQLKQVALNLVINALHAMEGRAERVLTVEVCAAGRAAELLVADTGTGIAPENLTRIFDPFFTTKGPERGTGLGLSVCFSIARQHGGDIRVDSRPGAGATFTLALRLEAAAAALADAGRPATVFSVPPARSGCRVLVVEDEIVLRRLLQEILCSRFGCRVDLASNGAEALEALKRGTDYALVLADIRMPVMTGTELYLFMKENYPEMARRFVFVTGHAGEKQLEAEISHWSVPLVRKPFTLARLAEACGPLLGGAAPAQHRPGRGAERTCA
jgi:signal transduction histidine kinase